MLEHYLTAFATILQPTNLFVIILGGMWGIIAGALPGISTSMGVVLLLPFTLTISPITAFTMLVACYCGGITGGSITSILFGIPGEPSAVCTVLEGHSLAKQGRAAYALWIYIIASVYGGIFAVLVMMAATPLIAGFALKFGPPEYFALTMMGLSIVAGLSSKSVLKGVISCLFGIFLAIVGLDGISGAERFTFGSSILLSGINLVTGMVGLLAISEIFLESEKPFQEYKDSAAYKGLRAEMPKLSEYVGNLWLMTKSSIIGTLVGALPGAGATISTFVAYGAANRSSKHPEKFGHGAPDGLIAAEAANNASTGGAMTILLSLGLPGGNATAMLIAAFLIHGMQPGPLMLVQRPDIVYGIFVAMLMSNIFLLGLSIITIKPFLYLNKLPYAAFSSAIVLMCVVGTFGLYNNMDDLYLMFVFGIVGYYMTKFGYPIAPAILGLVLGDLAELSLRRSLLLSLGDPLIFIQRPLCVILLLAALFSLLYPVFKKPKSVEMEEDFK
jgi:putative tricarboxylic transport membrane protein